MENRSSNRSANCNSSNSSNKAADQSSNRASNTTALNEHKHPNQYTKGADDESAKNSK